jgi:hypothetical protein
MKFLLEVSKLKIAGLTPAEIGAEDRGAAELARQEAIRVAEERFRQLAEALAAIPPPIPADPVGSAAAAQEAAIAFSRQLGADLVKTIPTPAQIGAEVAGAALTAQQNAIAFSRQLGADLVKTIPTTPAQIGAEVAGAAATAAAAAQQAAIAYCQQKISEVQTQMDTIYPTSAFIPWGFGKVLVGNPFGSGTLSTNVQLNRYNTQFPGQLNDEAEIEFLLKSGRYRLELWGARNTQQGIHNLYLNDALIGENIDRYAATTAAFVSTFTVNFSTTKIQKLRTKVIGKNPSSAGNQLWISAVLLYPT